MICQPDAMLYILPTIEYIFQMENQFSVSSPSLDFSTEALDEPPIKCLECIPNESKANLPQ